MSIAEDFEAFWDRYPRKIGRLAALKAYQKARALTLATADEILAGVDNYVAHMPDDPQYRCHAQTFLNQGRWMDSYDTPKVQKKPAAAIYKPYVRLKDRTG